ncbi:type II toxin-antitoxin system HicB family antitoxin [Rothia nasimurium]|uniref:type II toxin-antitoxin system HicB family antitoxin n=1 Tax=Rothia nasimurium TaxID=85336 RepID=UPI002DD64679|nr:toxin-antitoxin system HicB family antitoxin [Rothia nasimurium]
MIEHYTYRVTWSPEDHEYVATVLEMPSLSWLEPNELDALSGIKKLVAQVAQDMEANGEEIPQAFADRTYSGKLSLRIPPELHRRIAIEAQEQGISINRLLSVKIAA